MKIGNLLFGKLIPFFVRLTGANLNSWEFVKRNMVLQSLIMIPVKRIRGIRRTVKAVEQQYDQISGMYIKHNYYEGKDRFSVVDSEVKKINSVENMKLIRTEIREVLSEISFSNVLEVGVGELTSLEDVFRSNGPDLDCYGIDLSLNRLYHGVAEFKERHTKVPWVAKANAMKLPFPDNSFDLVYTRHTLEQMPEIYQAALDEIVRVSRRHVLLFEPSFELGDFAQKLKMLNSDYVRGIPKHLRENKKIDVKSIALMKNSANPLNHTACYKLEMVEPDVANCSSRVPFVCPLSHSRLKDCGTYLYSEESARAFPIIENIPLLDPDYSVAITELKDYH